MSARIIKVLSDRIGSLSTDDTEHLFSQRSAEAILEYLGDDDRIIYVAGEGDEPSRNAALEIDGKIYGRDGEIVLEISEYD